MVGIGLSHVSHNTLITVLAVSVQPPFKSVTTTEYCVVTIGIADVF